MQTAALNSDRVLGFSRIPEEGLGFLVLINLSNDDVTASSTVFRGVPNTGIVKIRSVNFKNRGAIVGGSIDTRSVILGPRDSLVVEFTPVR
ncbi:unnamed protein product [Allacma fusca]|uniref:Uncharacterized protein n=1 Tax=Allacma fusca TaxID=39272 RepID=A0A8J2JS55_9HEXA|nr:unnamed protein product [Allacma fusca]